MLHHTKHTEKAYGENIFLIFLENEHKFLQTITFPIFTKLISTDICLNYYPY